MGLNLFTGGFQHDDLPEAEADVRGLAFEMIRETADSARRAEVHERGDGHAVVFEISLDAMLRVREQMAEAVPPSIMNAFNEAVTAYENEARDHLSRMNGHATKAERDCVLLSLQVAQSVRAIFVSIATGDDLAVPDGAPEAIDAALVEIVDEDEPLVRDAADEHVEDEGERDATVLDEGEDFGDEDEDEDDDDGSEFDVPELMEWQSAKKKERAAKAPSWDGWPTEEAKRDAEKVRDMRDSELAALFGFSPEKPQEDVSFDEVLLASAMVTPVDMTLVRNAFERDQDLLDEELEGEEALENLFDPEYDGALHKAFDLVEKLGKGTVTLRGLLEMRRHDPLAALIDSLGDGRAYPCFETLFCSVAHAALATAEEGDNDDLLLDENVMAGYVFELKTRCGLE